ncbi:Hypothetical predicted protein, partial [Olea europaea subsp. europaea]
MRRAACRTPRVHSESSARESLSVQAARGSIRVPFSVLVLVWEAVGQPVVFLRAAEGRWLAVRPTNFDFQNGRRPVGWPLGQPTPSSFRVGRP